VSARVLAAAGRRAAIATPHTAATEAGAAAFEAGGNALDAALAAAVTLAVVYPHQCGVGGDLFALAAGPDGSVTAVNASGPAPRAIEPTSVAPPEGAMPEFGPATVTVPGAVAGWGALHALGAALPLSSAFGSAVRLAREGVPAVPFLAERLVAARDRLASDPGMAEIFYPSGRPLAEGRPFAQPALAETLEAIAAEGPRALFGGAVGERLAAGLQELGSAMTPGDLAAFEPEVGTPLSGPYHDLEVLVVPPNSQGFTLLQILAIVERSGIDPDPLGPDAGLLAAAFEAAAADRDRHNADPRFAPVPVEELLSEAHVDALGRAIRRGAPGPLPRSGVGDTVALVAADGEGRMVSLVQSLWSSFGSGLLERSTGIVLHNRGADFSLDPASPNVLAGGKRPAHTLLPVLVRRDGRPVAASGSRGGGGQAQINYASVVRAFDLGMAAAEALDAPRYLVGGMDLHPARYAEVEARVAAGLVDELRRAGYAITMLADRDDGVGHAHLILRTPDGSFDVATDPRADGAAWAR
jgi:gamma-glutamyltranspeptidase/glutathione hydrolase